MTFTQQNTPTSPTSLLQRRSRVGSEGILGKKSLPPRHLSVCVGNGIRSSPEMMSPTDALLSPVASKIQMVHRKSDPELCLMFEGTVDRDIEKLSSSPGSSSMEESDPNMNDVQFFAGKKTSLPQNTVPAFSSPLAASKNVMKKATTPAGI
eukprot:Nk52_evm5s351 gene=Nk52_evmTU5s351